MMAIIDRNIYGLYFIIKSALLHLMEFDPKFAYTLGEQRLRTVSLSEAITVTDRGGL
jgi:hypothetical protein